MRALVDWLRDRFGPAFLMAAGVTLLAGGLVSLGSEASLLGGAAPTAGPGDGDGPWLSASPGADGSYAGSSGDRVATRVIVPTLGIDLPVITPPGDETTYPPCDVAMFIQELGQPGQGRATYLYAHAREGMFLPMLEESRRDDGAGMLGALVEVYTSDDRLFLYEISEVRPSQLTLDDALAATTEELWLQTSEGPRGTRPKLQVLATFLSSGPAAHEAAHPAARPRTCD